MTRKQIRSYKPYVRITESNLSEKSSKFWYYSKKGIPSNSSSIVYNYDILETLEIILKRFASFCVESYFIPTEFHQNKNTFNDTGLNGHSNVSSLR